MKKILHYLNLLLNVSNHEWARIIFAWTLKLIIHIAFVMGSTIILAIFVDNEGIDKLPLMYIISAILVIMGSGIFAFLLEKYSKKSQILSMTFFSALLFAFSATLSDSSWLFYGSFFIALSFFIAQINIILALFIEEMFSPLESERTFPIIESSEPIGGIIAGIILTILVKYNHFHAINLLYVIAGILLIVFPIFFLFQRFGNKVPKLESKEEHENKDHSQLDAIKKGVRHIKGVPFLKSMFLIVFLQFSLVNLIEYQYTYVLDSELAAQQASSSHVESSHGRADALTHGLAFWHVMFSIVTFFSQILSGSRLQRHFGVIKTLQLHPIVNFISGIFTLISFGYGPAAFLRYGAAITSRGVFEVTGVIHRTSYHASFYALKRSIREQVKEFMEGVARPFGIIFGTSILMIILFVVPIQHQNTAISLSILIGMITMTMALSKMKKQYTLLAKKNLQASRNPIDKIEAVEILAQNGHQNVSGILGKNLFDKQHDVVVKSILQTLKRTNDHESLSDILKLLRSKKAHIQYEAIQTLSSFSQLNEFLKSHSFTKHRILELLKEVFLTTKSKKIKSEVVQVLKNIHHSETIPFLLSILENEDESLVADGVYVCGLFDDISISHYIEKHLSSEHPRLKSAAIQALWRFPNYRLKVLVQLTKMIESKEIEMRISGIHTIGLIGAIQETKRLERMLKTADEKEQMYIYFVLARFGFDEYLPRIIELLFHKEEHILEYSKKYIQKLPHDVYKKMHNLLVHEVSHKIHSLLLQAKTSILENMKTLHLKELQGLYELIAETKEILKIEEELKTR